MDDFINAEVQTFHNNYTIIIKKKYLSPVIHYEIKILSFVSIFTIVTSHNV